MTAVDQRKVNSIVLPEPHSSFLEDVCEAVSELKPSRLDATARQSDAYEIVERLTPSTSVIAITGERGSGKTSVLAAACERLVSEGHFVLPPVCPEFFGLHSSVFSTVLAGMQSVTRRTSDSQETAGDDLTKRASNDRLNLMLERALRRAGMMTAKSHIDNPHLRVDELAADLAISASVDSEFTEEWIDVVSAFRRFVRESQRIKSPIVIIPVDDPDLAPRELHSVLLELRLLTVADGICAIACLDIDEARAALGEAHLRDFPNTTDRSRLNGIVESQLTKSLPRSNRIEIRGLNPEQRLRFKPLGQGEGDSIEELIARFNLAPTDLPAETLATCLRLPSSNSPSPYAKCLPSNPRELLALYERLSIVLRSREPGQKKTSIAAAEFCQSAIIAGERKSAASFAIGEHRATLFEIVEQDDSGVLCRLDLESIDFYSKRKGSGGVEFKGTTRDSARVQIQFAHHPETKAKFAKQESSATRTFDSSLTNSLLLVREFAEAHNAIACEVDGGVPMRGGESAGPLLRLIIDEIAADDQFLLVPAWEAYFDYFALDEAIGEIVDTMNGFASHHEWRERTAAYVIDAWHQIAAVQRDRKGTARVLVATKRLHRAKSAKGAKSAITRSLEEVFEVIGEQYTLCLKSSTTRANDFVRWVEVLIPHVLHSAFIEDYVCDFILRARSDLLDSAGRLDAANSRLAASLERRIKRSIDRSWIAPMIPILATVDRDAADLLLASHRDQLVLRRRARARLLGNAAVEPEGLPASSQEHPGQFDVHEASDFEIAMSVLDTMRREAEEEARRETRD